MSSWGVIKADIQRYLDDPDFEDGGSREDLLIVWANKAINSIASNIEMRYLFKTVTTLLPDSNHWFVLPEDFLTISKRFTKVYAYTEESEIKIVGIDELDAMDFNHDLIANIPTHCAIEGNYLRVYPRADCTLSIHNYIRKPKELVDVSSIPDLPDNHILDDLIVSRVLSKYAYPLINEYELASFQQSQYNENYNDYYALIRASDSGYTIKRMYY